MLDKVVESIFNKYKELEIEYPLKLSSDNMIKFFDKYKRDIHNWYAEGAYSNLYLSQQDELIKHYDNLFTRWSNIYISNSKPESLGKLADSLVNQGKHYQLTSKNDAKVINDFFFDMREKVTQKHYWNHNLKGLKSNQFVNKVNGLAYNETLDYIKFMARER